MLTEEQLAIQDMARRFAQEHIKPFAAQWDEKEQYPKETIAAMGQLGLLGMVVPPEWGGAGTDYVSYVLAIEEIAAGDGACSTIMSVNKSVVCLPILSHGSEQQKKQFLTPLANGQALGCFCLTEAQAGTDAANLQTRAVRKGDHYVLNGSKQFITSGKNADYAIVIAVTDPTQGKKGFSAFVVPTHTKGYQVARLEKKLGQRCSDTAQIVFDQLHIPVENRLGAEGEGYKIALSHLETGRIGIAAQSVGMARAAYAIALDYAQNRQTFGCALIEHQAIAFRLADMATELEAARLLVLHAASRLDQGLTCLTEACMAKLFCSEMAERVCSAALQILGGYGYVQDFPIEKIYRDVRVTQIYEGTSDVQRMLISRQIVKV